ncbi:uncharacterized protein KD926_010488 [Aspergillus affinis]|uniref:uncharacterized protein n=1 Tax=Aspergillus affinis TaxID=1070780 RepID=UPI0022FE7FE4|nr:uncharacterized protein KD926_010488 [Aspergillus affinis]KAI9038753.1 hypothetical protein KD926_010488 [Aspergillus affinis]
MARPTQRVVFPPFEGLSQVPPLPSNMQYAPDYLPEPHNQGYNLPERTNITLPTISILQGRHDFDRWVYYAQAALDCWDLTQLINPHLPRPDPMSREYMNWRRWALYVSGWLRLHISPEVVENMILFHKLNMYPDELICTLSQLLFATLPNLLGNKAYETVLRGDFYTRSEYLHAMWGRRLYSVQRNIEVNLFGMVLTILKALESEIPKTVAAERDTLRQGIVLIVEETQFSQLLVRLSTAVE